MNKEQLLAMLDFTNEQFSNLGVNGKEVSDLLEAIRSINQKKITATKPKKEHILYSTCLAFSIGINSYQKQTNLKGAVNDANEMNNLFKSLAFKTKDPLLDDNATKKGIEEFLGEIQKDLEEGIKEEKEKKER